MAFCFFFQMTDFFSIYNSHLYGTYVQPAFSESITASQPRIASGAVFPLGTWSLFKVLNDLPVSCASEFHTWCLFSCATFSLTFRCDPIHTDLFLGINLLDFHDSFDSHLVTFQQGFSADPLLNTLVSGHFRVAQKKDHFKTCYLFPCGQLFYKSHIWHNLFVQQIHWTSIIITPWTGEMA